MRAFRNTFYAGDSPPPPLPERNHFTTHHFTSFRSRKAICFHREEHPPLPISIIFLVRAEPGFPALPNIRTRNFNPTRNAKPDNGTPPTHVHVREVIRDEICSRSGKVMSSFVRARGDPGWSWVRNQSALGVYRCMEMF
ncbi:hypothetical protein CDAR_580651 [Caerostris darwini]|uniref:Uncharacterized protein n=1 Tax=Caerostris darwini TaxID=1538125 RepID=A0AAV4TT74_9ARAC|nr:hypothetical protein CDAR_580651 [Caerostris darwini]